MHCQAHRHVLIEVGELRNGLGLPEGVAFFHALSLLAHRHAGQHALQLLQVPPLLGCSIVEPCGAPRGLNELDRHGRLHLAAAVSSPMLGSSALLDKLV